MHLQYLEQFFDPLGKVLCVSLGEAQECEKFVVFIAEAVLDVDVAVLEGVLLDLFLDSFPVVEAARVDDGAAIEVEFEVPEGNDENVGVSVVVERAKSECDFCSQNEQIRTGPANASLGDDLDLSHLHFFWFCHSFGCGDGGNRGRIIEWWCVIVGRRCKVVAIV